MSDAYQKLIKTLRTVFEMDKADLDFGIYRILNQKRAEINQFLEKDLLPQVQAAFADYAAGGKSELQAELMQAIEQARQFGVADPENAPPVVALKQKLASAVDLTALENEVYSHLHTFFSRYYDKGDFISQRRYKANTYAIPYEGEEVKLYWANHDQYYIKSSERLRDYAFTVQGHDGKIIRIKLVEADTEKDNVQVRADEERRFVLDAEQPLAVVDGELHIRFFYVPAGKKTQDALNEEAVRTIFQQTSFKDWLTALRVKAPTEKNPNRTLLEKHLNDYTARHTFDYFIHKDLGGFLRRELDFYIKNEVLYLDDIDDAAFAVTEQHLRKIKVIRAIALKIIRLLAQIEDFQKKLWLKKKFVVETQYCITLDRVPDDLYEKIAENQAQQDEWVRLFAINEIKGYTKLLTIDFLKANNKLVLDTRFFDERFKDQLLASIENFDEQCDGLLIHSENFQALNLLQERYRQQVKCIHIDPPYNTSTSGFLYKNYYEHSSWMSMMNDRISISKYMMIENGDFICHIDENEYERLSILFEYHQLFSSGTIIWDKKNPMLGRKGIATQHEYIIYRSKVDIPIMGQSDAILKILKQAKLIIDEFGISDISQKKLAKWLSNQDELTGGEKLYKYIDSNGDVYRLVAMGAPEKRKDQKFYIPLIHPVTGKECPVPPNGWSRTPETISELIDQGLVVFGSDETTQPQKKVYLRNDAQKQITSVYSDGRSGKGYLDELGLDFPYAHPVSMYERLLSTSFDQSIFLDFFAGSGTNGHAVINLSRKNKLNHKSILIEMGNHFYSALIPRIIKVIYSDSWVDGKPTARNTGISHCFKYLCLESYEDALNNLRLKDRTKPQQTLLDDNIALREDYLLGYWLDVETADSPSLINIDQFEDPFNYQINIATGSVGAFKPTRVDLVETFNYLIGLRVKHTDTLRGFKVITGTNPKDESVLIIWRNIKEKDNAALEDFLNKQQYNPRDTEFDHLYVNGDHTLDDPHSKVKMIEIEFKRLMFDVQGV